MDGADDRGTVTSVVAIALPPTVAVHRREFHGLLDRALHHSGSDGRYAEASSVFTALPSRSTSRSALMRSAATYLVMLEALLPPPADQVAPSVAAVRRMAATGVVSGSLDVVFGLLTSGVRDGTINATLAAIDEQLDDTAQTIVLLALFAVVVELSDEIVASRPIPARLLLQTMDKQFV